MIGFCTRALDIPREMLTLDTPLTTFLARISDRPTSQWLAAFQNEDILTIGHLVALELRDLKEVFEEASIKLTLGNRRSLELALQEVEGVTSTFRFQSDDVCHPPSAGLGDFDASTKKSPCKDALFPRPPGAQLKNPIKPPFMAAYLSFVGSEPLSDQRIKFIMHSAYTYHATAVLQSFFPCEIDVICKSFQEDWPQQTQRQKIQWHTKFKNFVRNMRKGDYSSRYPLPETFASVFATVRQGSEAATKLQKIKLMPCDQVLYAMLPETDKYMLSELQHECVNDHEWLRPPPELTSVYTSLQTMDAKLWLRAETDGRPRQLVQEEAQKLHDTEVFERKQRSDLEKERVEKLTHPGNYQVRESPSDSWVDPSVSLAEFCKSSVRSFRLPEARKLLATGDQTTALATYKGEACEVHFRAKPSPEAQGSSTQVAQATQVAPTAPVAQAGGQVAQAAEVEHEVEKLVGLRTQGNNVEYLVRWAGYTEEEDSWESVSNISPGLIEDFDLEQLSDFEKRRLKTIQRNTEFLAASGLIPDLEEGAETTRKSKRNCTRKAPSPSPSPEPKRLNQSLLPDIPLALQVGQRVRASWKTSAGRNKWYKGRIFAINKDQTLHIHYDDGDEERNVQQDTIELLEN